MNKKLHLVKGLRVLSIILVFSTILAGCQKDKNPTPLPQPILSKKMLLVKPKWQVDEVLRNINGTNSHYKRGGVNDTGVNYDLIELTFNTDGTGTYQDEVGVTHPITWQFTTSDNRNLHLNIGPPYATSFDWNLVEITPDALHNTTAVGSGVLVSARYRPVLRDFPNK